MLAPVVAHSSGLDLSNTRVVSDLMASFKTQRPKLPPSLPDWDVTFVLYMLTKARFEPLDTCPLKLLSYKTLFLLLLASGRRRSDIHALDVDRVEFDARDSSVTLYPDRSFLPKTRAAAEGAHAFSPIRIPALTDLVGPEEPDATLCPVRMLRVYLDRTSAFRRGRRRLFISFQPNRESEISIQTLSIWVKDLIQHVYQTADIDALRLYKVTAHQVRHISMSLASAYNVSLEAVVRSGMWTNSSTFTNHYLADARSTTRQVDRFRLGPLIAAQSVVNTHTKLRKT